MMIVCLHPELEHVPWVDDVPFMSVEIESVMRIRREALRTPPQSSPSVPPLGAACLDVVGGSTFAEDGATAASCKLFFLANSQSSSQQRGS